VGKIATEHHHACGRKADADHEERDCRVNDWRNFENFTKVTAYRSNATRRAIFAAAKYCAAQENRCAVGLIVSLQF
jgi:hypothetical protein